MPTPLQGFRFMVMFVENLGFPQVLDMRFSKVSGLHMSTGVHTIKSGGQNLFDYRFPDGVKYENLVLTRGMPMFSPLRFTLEEAFESYEFSAATVFIFLQGESGLPLAGWQFENAFPVKWSFSDLDASQGSPVVETMELAYERFTKIL
jgi:phage tail-like protein